MASYAPLFAHVDAWQWTPNLLWTDNLRTLRTPNYHVQSLFARNRGDRILPVTLARLTAPEEKRLYASSVLDDSTGEVVLKLVNVTGAEATAAVELAGVRQVKPGTVTVLQAVDLKAVNSPDGPDRVAPRETAFAPAGAKFSVTLPANSFSVVRVGVVR